MIPFLPAIPFKIYAFGIAILAVVLVSWFGYNYVTNMQKRIVEQAQELAIKDGALKSANSTIVNLKQESIENEQANIDLQIKLQTATSDLDELRQKLLDHDLTRLATAKPGLIEKRINDATEKLFNDIERITTP